MLQFNTVVCTATTKFTSRLWGRINVSLTTTATPLPLVSSKTVKKTEQKKVPNIENISSEQNMDLNELKKTLCNSFILEPLVVTKIQNATNINDLMKVTDSSLLSKNDTIKLKEAIITWIKQNAIEKHPSHDSSSSQQENEETTLSANSIKLHEDLSMFDDLSTSGIIMELYKLSCGNERNVPLLKYLYQNILKHNKLLNGKQCSSILISMSKLSYPDEELLKKICTDLQVCSHFLMDAKNLSTILRSMAVIKYKNDEFLEVVCNYVEKSAILEKCNYITQILMSLALLGYESQHINNLIEKYLSYIKITIIKDIDWLNFVWSLVVFNAADTTLVESVLKNTFIERLMTVDPKQNVSHTLKLLNINGYAKSALKNYSGPLLRNVEPFTSKQTAQKVLYVQALEETLKNVVPSTSHFKMNVNTNMGFLLDAELYMDSNFRPVRINDVKDDHIKIAIMILDYHDMCIGTIQPHGVPKLQQRLLRYNNYELLTIPYSYFGIEDKLERRVAYLKRQLWKKYNK